MPANEEPTARFRCPKCGSQKFGTSLRPLPITMYCHGEGGCRFHFYDADRWRYFELRGESFVNQAQYDAHLARWLDQMNGIIRVPEGTD